MERLALGVLGCLLLVACSGGETKDTEGSGALAEPGLTAAARSALPSADRPTEPSRPVPAVTSPSVPAATSVPAASRPSSPAPRAASRRTSPFPAPAPSPRPSPATSPAARPSPSPAPAPERRALTIENFAFWPPTMTVEVGTVVTATNKDGVVHTWTSDDGVWDSGSLAQGESFSFTFRTPGTYSYHCRPHPHMTGSVTVKQVPGAAVGQASAS